MSKVKKKCEVILLRKSSEKFRVGDRVILQETTGTKRQWLETGVIKEQRFLDDGSFQSFIVDLDKDSQCLRNKRFLKHYRKVTFTNRNDGVMDFRTLEARLI